MPGRKTKLITGDIYHVFNKCLDSNRSFNNKGFTELFLKLLYFYRPVVQPFSYSDLKRLSSDTQKSVLTTLNDKESFQIDILAYCLMPNHFHLLLRQREESGISRYLSNVQNAFTRTYNQVVGRQGSLFLTNFKAVHIRTEEHLLHTSRYIHLNPSTAGLVDDPKDYEWSSLKEYLGSHHKRQICETKTILGTQQGAEQQYHRFVFR